MVAGVPSYIPQPGPFPCSKSTLNLDEGGEGRPEPPLVSLSSCVVPSSVMNVSRTESWNRLQFNFALNDAPLSFSFSG